MVRGDLQSATRASAFLLIVLTSCTGPSVAGRPALTPSATRPSPPSSPPEKASFSASRALETVRALTEIGPREAASPAYRQAADLVLNLFASAGYQARLQRVRVPAGTVDGLRVPSGATFNIVAEPPGFDPGKGFAVVGGHLDTAPDSPGANDNASGVAVLIELARMVAIEPPPLPVVFVAFGAEERRRVDNTHSRTAMGSRAYLASLGEARANVRAGIVVDMVGRGRRLNILGRGAVRRLALTTAGRLGIDTASAATGLYSDHVAFYPYDIPAVWLWSGEHSTLHTPRDVESVVRASAVARAGRVAWETLRSLR